MKITNKTNLPESYYRAVAGAEQPPAKNVYRVTSIIDPPRRVQLMLRHNDDIEMDCIDFFDSFLGNSVHHVMQMNAPNDWDVEKRLFAQIEGRTVTGQPDVIFTNKSGERELKDYKTSSTWKFRFGDMDSWIKQLNIYNILAGGDIKRATIVAFFKDWKASQNETTGDYPPAPILELEMPLEPKAWAEWLRARVIAHKEAEDLEDDQLPPCTDEERWARGGEYAVMKKGNKRAIKLFQKEDEAKAMADADKAYYVEKRPVQYIRCERYCPVARFCNQHGGCVAKQ